MNTEELESLAAQLEQLTTANTHWCVGPDSESIEVWFDRESAIWPEQAAHNWLAEQNENNPGGRFRDYIVFKHDIYSQKDEAIREIAQKLRKLDSARPRERARQKAR